MKPRRIIIIRHGEATHNVDRNVLKETPDFAIPLTAKGKQQAFDAGKKLAKIIGKNFASQINSTRVYCSPYWRTRETFVELAKTIKVEKFLEHPGLREQEWGPYIENARQVVEEARSLNGHFYYRIPGGESCADVFTRLGEFENTFFRDCVENYPPETCIFVTHSMTMRVLLMRLLNIPVEDFELLASPGNAEYHILEYENTGYILKTVPRTYKEHRHSLQFNWQGMRPKGFDNTVKEGKIAIP